MKTQEEEEQVPKLGGRSVLLVPSVQELAKEPLAKLPPRYIRAHEDSPIISHTNPSSQVPVIDMQKLFNSPQELEQLHHACKDWGFFQVINHGVSSWLVEKMKMEVQQLFNLPMEEKKKLWQKPDDMEGFGAYVFSEEQKLNWGDLFYIVTHPTYLRKPHLFSNLPLTFRETLEAYYVELKQLAMKLLDLMAKALGMDSDEMRVLFEEGFQAIRMNYYPPCPEPELAIGLNPHSDSSGITILLQINEMEGLQIKKNGAWIPVKPLPDAFVINIGDIIEIVSNGVYRSVEHRATVNSVKERLTVATFYLVNLDGDVGPAPSLITPQNPPLFKRIGFADYLNGFLSRDLREKSNVELLRIQNEETNTK